ncbi:amidophosphoribosyltransferase-like [Paramacrobiotus metropolitanus]|uniref:amidophosphoribosyltransferase-like n=1 Tax=Paramacrobiotus metropolitanus TaxID=2943436 RepID=UPI0024458A5C|nr:amidophosphoribosyltransferase-like [Paramacrobiotus metropolitanus]XP_055356572.1 amidophosphoribosyltransferase-like [Paramacrobiotus metropolitanus]
MSVRDPDYESGLREECAVFGCVAAGPWPATGECVKLKVHVAETIINGLVGLQHRGQESSGVVVATGSGTDPLKCHRGMGLVSAVYRDEDVRHLEGNLGIGHNRYSTAGRSHLVNCQPLTLEGSHGHMAIAHNGEIVNAEALRHELFLHGTAFSSESDTELLLRALLLLHKDSLFGSRNSRRGSNNSDDSPSDSGRAMMSPSEKMSPPDWPRRLAELMRMFPLAYSFLFLNGDAIYAVRDCFGNRPLVLGKISSENNPSSGPYQADAWIVASESCCFKNVPHCKLVREVYPGEVVKITKDGFSTVARVEPPEPTPLKNGVELPEPVVPNKPKATAFCLFEYVYFARGDSYFEGQQVYGVRERCGRRLAKESHVDADIVSNVPDSSRPAALGFSKESGIEYSEVFLRNPYIGRTFIQPTNTERQSAVFKKFGELSANYAGKRIVLIDDSIVRGNTLQGIVKLLKDTGAKEVHIRIASPPVRYPCYMGIAIPTREELIANQISMEELPKYFGADSVAYLSIDGLIETVQEGAISDFRSDAAEWRDVKRGYCSACFTNDYPIIPVEHDW